MIEIKFASEEVDILLISEGSFPFVKGGVSSWISSLIENLPEYKFGVIFLGAYRGMYKKYLFHIPDNLKHLQISYLFKKEYEQPVSPKNEPSPQAIKDVLKLHDIFKRSHGVPNGLVESPKDLGRLMSSEGGFSFAQFLRSNASWQIITQQYSQYSTDPSFIDYFWNIRNVHEPLWHLQPVLDQAPKAKIIQSVSTGYAGLLASMLKQRYQIPFVLTEHGLYSKERSIELIQSSMFMENDRLISNTKQFSYQHSVWINFFDSLARKAYDNADRIISLFKVAQTQQQAYGADPKKTLVIPNGINIKKFSAIRRPLDAPIPKIVCFVGRIIRIKDVKTFIRSMAITVSEDSSIKGWIKSIGDDDPAYVKECIDYVRILGLEDNIEFISKGDMLYVLERIGVLILTSISEGMPLVVLEAMATGIPVIATDVGSCREIIDGQNEEDDSIGSAGSVVSVLNAKALADATIELLNDPEKWHAAGKAGIERAEKYFDQKTMIEAYRNLYQELS